MERPYLGRGWGFPTRLDADGRVALSEGEDAVAQSIELILSTALGERLMRPDFGCGLHGRLFAPGGADETGQLAGEIQRALARWEHRVDVLGVDVRRDPVDPASRSVRLDVRIRATNSRLNVVYPFYLEAGATEPVDG